MCVSLSLYIIYIYIYIYTEREREIKRERSLYVNILYDISRSTSPMKSEPKSEAPLICGYQRSGS